MRDEELSLRKPWPVFPPATEMWRRERLWLSAPGPLRKAGTAVLAQLGEEEESEQPTRV